MYYSHLNGTKFKQVGYTVFWQPTGQVERWCLLARSTFYQTMYGRALPENLGIQRERSALSGNEYYIHITHSDARFYNSTKVGFPIEVKNTLGHLKHRLHLYSKGGLRRGRGLTILCNSFSSKLDLILKGLVFEDSRF